MRKAFILLVAEAAASAVIFVGLAPLEASTNPAIQLLTLLTWPAFWLAWSRVLWSHMLKTGGPHLSDSIGTALVAGMASVSAIVIGVIFGVALFVNLGGRL